MGNSLENWLIGVALAPYLLLVWFASRWFGLVGTDLWVLRGLLVCLGITSTVAVFKWLRSKRAGREHPSGAGQVVPETVGARHMIDSILRKAGLLPGWLRFSKYRNLPLVFLVGPTGAGKTVTMKESGLARAWLAGDGESPPSTRWVNCWLASNAVFLEVAGRLLADEDGWRRLLARLRPGRIESAFGKGERSTKAAVVCFSLAEVTGAESGDAALSAAEWLGLRLREAADHLGVSFPVYVVFTGMDKLRGFEEFGRHLSESERNQVFGVTLPLASRTAAAGTVIDDQARHLGNAFNDLFYSLCDQRARLLSFEGSEASRYALYEFPREVWKLRSLLIPFLATLSERTPLGPSPFLRGFYFSASGVVVSTAADSHERARQLVDTERVEGLSPQERTWLEAHLGACDVCAAFASSTEYALHALISAPLSVPPDLAAVTSRRVRQGAIASSGDVPGRSECAPDSPLLLTRDLTVRKKWAPGCSQSFFLHRLFADTVLRDQGGRALSGFNHSVSAVRRLLLTSASAILFLLTIGFSISYLRNRALEDGALDAAQDLEASGNLRTSLEGLEKVRLFLDERLAPYEHGGRPWSCGWGLYAGKDLDLDLKKVYFGYFRTLLLDPASQSLQSFLKRLPSEPVPEDDYHPAYGALKAYLMTTSNPDKSDAGFLADVLASHWAEAVNERDNDETVLAREQFFFYARQLGEANPYSDRLADPTSVGQGRTYLKRFLDPRVVYHGLLARVEGAPGLQSVDFGRQYSNWQSVLTRPPVVPPVFTRPGWKVMQDAIGGSRDLFRTDAWVLNEPSPHEQDLRNLYQADYVSQWLAFLRGASVRNFGPGNVAQALRTLTDSRSPLLELMCVVAQNTDEDGIRSEFQPLHSIVDPGSCVNELVSGSNRAYVDALRALQAAYQNSNADAAELSQMRQAAMLAARRIEDGFQWKVASARETQRLIESALGTLPAPANPVAERLNSAAAMFCRQLLLSELPFRQGNSEASLSDFDAVFQPKQGTLWTGLYHGSGLDQFLKENGPDAYAVQAGFSGHLNSRFVSFFNRSALISRTMYASGSTGPGFTYSITPHHIEGVRAVDLAIDGKQLRYDSATPSQFAWPGSREGVVLTVTYSGGSQDMRVFPGVWGVFKFFAAADKWEPAANSYRFQWTLRPQVGREASRAYNLWLSVNPGNVFAALPALDCTSSAASR